MILYHLDVEPPRRRQMHAKWRSTRDPRPQVKRLVSKAYETQSYRCEIAFYETIREGKHLRAEISKGPFSVQLRAIWGGKS